MRSLAEHFESSQGAAFEWMQNLPIELLYRGWRWRDARPSSAAVAPASSSPCCISFRALVL